MALNRLAASLFTASNDNTIALANLNFDFTLIKYEAPGEFQALGEKLSIQRRKDAEEGPVHQTARRLGALFEELVPPTPKLIKAYGLRSSEIASLPGVSPRGTRNDGPFEAFIGADGTSLWAAATSARRDAPAHAPLSMHLLACMLARAWEADRAIAIWVEIVNERRREIDRMMDSEPQMISACWAARQKISRKQLAIWDASARSWLRTADEARASERIRLMLILNNLDLPSLSCGKSTYEDVIRVWREAMFGMERLLYGMPQKASNLPILLALSAWHIFPDLVVLGESPKHISFADDLVKKGGTITIGLQSASEEPVPGMQWSLALSHFRYYGDPITVHAESDNPRVTMDQLLLVVFGSIMSFWAVPPKEQNHAARWLVTLHELLSDDEDMPKWLFIILKAADLFLRFENENKETCDLLVAWGRRRGKQFLSKEDIGHTPFFGLCNPYVQLALRARCRSEVGVEYLRAIAECLGLQSHNAILRYKHVFRTAGRRRGAFRYEYATAVPHLRKSSKRSQDGSFKIKKVHSRWLSKGSHFSDILEIRCDCAGCCTEDCLCNSHYGGCNEDCHPHEERNCHTWGNEVRVRLEEIWSNGEECHLITWRDLQGHSAYDTTLDRASAELQWQNPPLLFRYWQASNSQMSSCPSFDDEGQCSCFKGFPSEDSRIHEIEFRFCHGDPDDLGLYIRLDSPILDRDTGIPDMLPRLKAANAHHVPPRTGMKLFKDADQTVRVNVAGFLCDVCPGMSSSATSKPFLRPSLLPGEYILPLDYVKSLEALNFAYIVYKSLDGATIPLCVTSRLLTVAQFCKDGSKDIDMSKLASEWSTSNTNERHLLARAQSCIAFFESGIQDIPVTTFETVVAMANANSIYVTEALLSDPIESERATFKIRRIIGNIGEPGLSLLVLPQQPAKIRSLSHDFRVVPHVEYDGKRENNYIGTSLHLSFTNWRRPINISSYGAIDEAVSLIECFISVHDRGRWVADLEAFTGRALNVLRPRCVCSGSGDAYTPISLDDWEELLDAPDGIGIFRAHKNWAARLAAASIRNQQGHEQSTFLIPPDCEFCPKCLANEFLSETGTRVGVIID